ncbi:hypothetical protein AWV80_12490 [Cupriavidus sp. UYMU48A]|nr:hypothetical protein AWV80_12490 [Cupriavidus sp. UYMU48A]
MSEIDEAGMLAQRPVQSGASERSGDDMSRGGAVIEHVCPASTGFPVQQFVGLRYAVGINDGLAADVQYLGIAKAGHWHG